MTTDTSDLRALKKDVASLKTDVALLKQSNEKVVEPALESINTKLDTMSYVPIKEFVEYQKSVNSRFAELRKRSWRENTISAVFGSLLTLIVAFIFDDLMKRGG